MSCIFLFWRIIEHPVNAVFFPALMEPALCKALSYSEEVHSATKWNMSRIETAVNNYLFHFLCRSRRFCSTRATKLCLRHTLLQPARLVANTEAQYFYQHQSWPAYHNGKAALGLTCPARQPSFGLLLVDSHSSQSLG